MGDYERSSTNGYVQGFDTLFWDDNRINALSNAAQGGEAQLFLSDTLAPKESYGHRPLITISS